MKAINYFSRAITYLPLFLVIAMMLLIVSDVFMRYVFSRPISGTAEISRMMMVFMLLYLVQATLEGRHIKVDLVINHLSPRIQAILEVITLTLSLAIYIILTWRGFESALYAQRVGIEFSVLKVPHYPFISLMTLGLAFFCLGIAARIIERVGFLISGQKNEA